MKVEDLKKALENFPDDALLVRPGFDHSYHRIYSIMETTASQEKYGLFEWYDSDELESPGELIKVVVIE